MFHDPATVTMSKPAQHFTAKGAWICHTGKVRKNNEDACLFGGIFGGASMAAPILTELDQPGWIVSVADGIGGHKAGAYASREVVTALAGCTDVTPEGVNSTIVETNRRLHKSGSLNPDLSGTGAAVVGMFAGVDELYAFNVGDARLYRQEGGRLRQITRDDSVEQMLVEEGLMRSHDGIRPANMHALTQSVGGSREYVEIEPHFYLLPVAKDMRFILCTDGLTDMLSARDMERVVIPLLNPAAAVSTLFNAAMDAGGKDNITVAVVDVHRSQG